MPSAQDHDRQTIEIEDAGRTVASADIQGTDRPGTVHTDLHVESGPLPAETRAHLVDAVLEHPDVHAADHLVATMPLEPAIRRPGNMRSAFACWLRTSSQPFDLAWSKIGSCM